MRPPTNRWSRYVPNYAGNAYGELQCLWGFVWRGAYPRDFTCSIADVRTNAATQNTAAESNLALLLA